MEGDMGETRTVADRRRALAMGELQRRRQIAGARDYDRPVSSLDIFATLAARLGLHSQAGKPLDGVDLIPFLSGAAKGDPHPALFWRKFDQKQGAVVAGDVKFIVTPGETSAFNLKADIGYRYRRVEGGDMFGYAQNGGPGYDKGFDVHEARLGARYTFD